MSYHPVISSLAISPAASQDVVTYVWDAGCNHTMTTNHFVLPAQGTAEVYVDLSKCSDEQLGSLLFFGYKTTKDRSRRQAVRRNPWKQPLDKMILARTEEFSTAPATPQTRFVLHLTPDTTFARMPTRCRARRLRPVPAQREVPPSAPGFAFSDSRDRQVSGKD